MAHYTNPKRMWFTERGKIAFVESGSNTTVDGVTSSLISISEAKTCLIKGISLPTHFPIGDDIGYAQSYTDNDWGPLTEIPTQFHEALAFKVIAMGYKDPRNMKIELAQYFDNEYDKVCKQAKKYARSNFQSTGQIVPQEY
jgi:hypothetical protein